MHMDRRYFLGSTGAVMISGVAAPAAALVPEVAPRRLDFECTHTGECGDVEYWAEDRYLADATAAIDHVLRDFRTGEVNSID